MFKCPECDYSQSSLNSLRIHASKRHKISSEDLYVRLVLNGNKPVCKCGCGSITKFNSLSEGYSDYIQGHASRVVNNWGHNQSARLKSLKKRRDEGLWNKLPWNKGKTKENDPSFASLCESAYGTIEWKTKKSKLMKKFRLSKIVPDLSGSLHPQWKGGTSAMQSLVRSHLHMPWVFPKLKASNFTCNKCGTNKNLVVHHDRERFADILHSAVKLMGEPGESFEKKFQIAEWVVKYHIENDVSGIVLCYACHALEHKKD